jgi:hypothetical protein
VVRGRFSVDGAFAFGLPPTASKRLIGLSSSSSSGCRQVIVPFISPALIAGLRFGRERTPARNNDEHSAATCHG